MARNLASQPIGVKSSLVTSHAHARVHHQVARLFSQVSQGHVFRLHDGVAIDSLWLLAERLKSMSQETYDFHANHTKNDFSSWLRDVHKNHDLADRILSAQGKDHAAKIVKNSIVNALFEAAHR